MRPELSSPPTTPAPHLALRGAVLGGLLFLVLPWDLVLLGSLGALGLLAAPLTTGRDQIS